MKIKFIGTGSGLNPTLGNTAFVVEGDDKNSNKKLLIDCGFTVTPELHKQGILKDITDIAITHLHSDHVGGLELLGFMNYFAYKRRGNDLPTLHLATPTFARKTWNLLREGMETGQWYDEDMRKMCEEGKHDFGELEKKGIDNYKFTPFRMTDYFNVNIATLGRYDSGKPRDDFETVVGDLKLIFQPRLHAPFMENYGIEIQNSEGSIWYSGDTVEALPRDAELSDLVFHDCQFFEGGVHVSYDSLKKKIERSMHSEDYKRKTYLVHLGGGWEKIDPKKDGFAGFVMPGDEFEIKS